MAGKRKADDVSWAEDWQVSAWLARSEVASADLHVSEPREVAWFSRDAKRNLQYGSRAMLRSFYLPSSEVDLNIGFDKYVAKLESDVGLEPVLHALAQSQYDTKKEADVITYRNNLLKIGLTPYSKKDPWEIRACNVDGTVFLDIVKLEEPPPNEQTQRFLYYGYRFEQACTGDVAGEDPVNANEEFCTIVRLRIGTTRILLSAEIDCEDKSFKKETDTHMGRYIELKTSRKPDRPQHFRTLRRFKYLKFWLQSYLAGTSTIYLGFRNDQGLVVKIERIRTKDLPKLCGQEWNPWVCLNFINETLSTISHELKTHGEIRIRYIPALDRVVVDPYDPARDGCSFRERVAKAVSEIGNLTESHAETGDQTEDGGARMENGDGHQ
uniref:Decapping nuclease n=1 Tax=Compsopogon caeruleus TaxID=31354 RepID=A0A7S1XF81_9RHOD|mmetsp:Transcript_3377/g.6334  ORF Transcript_3377/g.6334 Transcript_3377/m.6334 type:complete len:382 (+) Transcript_3377:162-1307(+)